jgi:hypothetical protein
MEIKQTLGQRLIKRAVKNICFIEKKIIIKRCSFFLALIDKISLSSYF